MTLKQWQDNGWLCPHQTSRQEIENLLAIVEYDAASMATEKEAQELREFTIQLKRTVLDWLKENHPEFLQ